MKEYLWLDGRLIAVANDVGDLYHVHTGHLGQPLAMTDALGAVVWDADLEPFGKASVLTSSVANDHRLP